MSNYASLARSALGALVVALPIVAIEVSAAEPSQAAEAGLANGQAAEATEPVRPPGFACGDKELTGSGPGFDSSREHSQETAKADWLAKARAIYTDASWETAKEFESHLRAAGALLKMLRQRHSLRRAEIFRRGGAAGKEQLTLRAISKSRSLD